MTDRVPHLIAALVAGAFFLAAAPPAAAQQTGAIAGVVVDGGNGETLPGANVSLKETTVGTATDLNGRYKIKELEPGTYDVVFSFVGFQRKTVTGVEVTAGATTTLDVTLQPESRQLDEVVVSAEVAKDSEAGLLKKRQKAAAVSDAISAELMSQSGASSAADAMKKMTGASVTDGKYVNVRGLGGRYTNAQLNGLELPTASADKNAVQFDLFSSNMLDNISTSKTFTPDQPGDFAGGLINLNTESYPSDLVFKVSSSVSVDTRTHFNDDFLSYPGGDYDFLGIDDGTRDIPSFIRDLPEDQIPTSPESTKRRVGDEIDENGWTRLDQLGENSLARRVHDLSRSFNNVMGPESGRAPINQSYSIGIGNEVDLFGNPLGFLLDVNYGYSSSGYDDGFSGLYRAPQQEGSLDQELLVDQALNTTEASLGGLFSANYTLARNHEIGTNVLYSRRGESESSQRSGQWFEQFGSDTTVVFQDRNLRYTERQIYSTQLRGKHLFPSLSNFEAEWKVSFSDTRQEEPDTRIFGNLLRLQVRDGQVQDSTYTVDLNGFSNPTRFYRDLSEDSYNAKLDLTLPFDEGQSRIKIGGAYRDESREFAERSFVFDPQGAGVRNFEGDPFDYFAEDNRGILDIETLRPGSRFEAEDPVFGLIPFEDTETSDSYSGDRTIGAAYAMADLQVTDWFRVVGGARVERTDLQVSSPALPDTSDRGQVEVTDVLPSMNLVFQLQDNMNLRAAATRTLARPTFREIAPFVRRPFVLGETIIGNPELDRTLITNVDVRWEWFPAPGEIVAVSAFGKDLQNAIEVNLLPTTNGQRSWANTDARVFGAEFEVRTRLDRIDPALEHFTVGTNLSLVQSEAEVTGVEDDFTRQLQGQSPYTFNFDVTYDNPEDGTTIGLYYNTFGERLTALGLPPKPNVFEQPFHQLNVNLSQRFMDHWTLSASVDNLLGDTSEEVHTFGDRQFDYLISPRGREISIGLSYEL
jgi:outer membrane receptor protein involved in Fe transport